MESVPREPLRDMKQGVVGRGEGLTIAGKVVSSKRIKNDCHPQKVLCFFAPQRLVQLSYGSETILETEKALVKRTSLLYSAPYHSQHCHEPP